MFLGLFVLCSYAGLSLVTFLGLPLFFFPVVLGLGNFIGDGSREEGGVLVHRFSEIFFSSSGIFAHLTNSLIDSILSFCLFKCFNSTSNIAIILVKSFFSPNFLKSSSSGTLLTLKILLHFTPLRSREFTVSWPLASSAWIENMQLFLQSYFPVRCVRRHLSDG